MDADETCGVLILILVFIFVRVGLHEAVSATLGHHLGLQWHIQAPIGLLQLLLFCGNPIRVAGS